MTKDSKQLFSKHEHALEKAYEVCPECGEVVDKGRYARDNNMHTLRVVYDSIWYKPSTWGSHYYELLKE